MALNKFEYSPLATATYKALLWFTIVIGYHYHNALIYYISFMLFLGIGLRPLLERTGLHELYLNFLGHIDDKRDRKLKLKIDKEVTLKVRDDKYRNKRTIDPALPKNW